MILKYKGKNIEVSDAFIQDCGMHAVQRGMTLEEYIAEAFTMLETKPVTIINDKLLYQSTAGLKHNGDKIEND
jgi:hypothetical protein